MWIAIFIVVALALGLAIALYFQVKASHRQSDEQQQLLSDYQQRVDEQQKLLDDYRALEKNFDSVGEGYEQALLAFDKMEEEQQQARQTNEALESRCATLQEQCTRYEAFAKLAREVIGQALVDMREIAKTTGDNKLTALIGKDAYTADGDLNKAVVAQFLLASEDHRHAINAIVHPAVFNDFITSGIEWVESAILFECGLDRLTDVNIVVTAPEEVRIQRVMQRDHISREQAQAWIGRQWPQQRLQELADYEIVNDGQADINEQINKIIQLCKKPF